MARQEWTRWGRGDCEGYSLAVGEGFSRFAGEAVRSVRQPDGSCFWYSRINGTCEKTHATREEAMDRVEFELKIAGETFIAQFAAYKEARPTNLFSIAVDALRFVKTNEMA